MRKNITTASQSQEKKPVFVQLRLPKSLAEDLRNQGKPAGRKLPAEIIHRLKGGDELPIWLYGWVSPQRDKLLGQVVGMLAGTMEEFAGADPEQDQGAVLGLLKVAVNELLDGLGASEEHLPGDSRAHAAFYARQMVNQMKWAGLQEPRELAPDKAIIAKLGEAWGVKTEKG